MKNMRKMAGENSDLIIGELIEDPNKDLVN
jgi:hypothetical protein